MATSGPIEVLATDPEGERHTIGIGIGFEGTRGRGSRVAACWSKRVNERKDA